MTISRSLWVLAKWAEAARQRVPLILDAGKASERPQLRLGVTRMPVMMSGCRVE